jgi:hypothetical protein
MEGEEKEKGEEEQAKRKRHSSKIQDCADRRNLWAMDREKQQNIWKQEQKGREYSKRNCLCNYG